MTRREFTAKTKTAAADRAADHCEECTAKVGPGNIEFDHRVPDGLGGEPTVDNCVVLCKTCHRGKTSTRDVPQIAKAKRRQRKSLGIRKQSGFRAWRKFNGDIVWRER